MPEALIFDVDGTLAETEELHRRAFNETFAAAGLGWHWSRGDYRRLLKTTGGKERMVRHLQETGDPAKPDIAALHRDKTARYAALVADGALALRPGIAGLIAAARARGLRLAVATTTSRPNVEALCLACFKAPAGQVFDVIAAGDEVAAKKPAPDVYLLALDRLGLPPGAVLAFEDSRNGLLASAAAGVSCIVSPSVYTGDEVFPEAALVVAGFDDPALITLLDKPAYGAIP